MNGSNLNGMEPNSKNEKSNNADYVLPSADERPAFVNKMFAEIAQTYDLMNRIMALGMDGSWRREMLALCDLPPNGMLLDVGTGTGDIGYEALQRYPGLKVYGADFTYEMMAAGTGKVPGHNLPFTQADTFDLPYADNTFDAVVCGFLVRNVLDRVGAFAEHARVAKPGGKVVCLEITPPSNTVLGPLFQFYFFKVVPFVGSLISDNGEAYSYLPQSTVDFPSPDVLQRAMEEAGLHHVSYREKMMGTVAIHVGTK